MEKKYLVQTGDGGGRLPTGCLTRGLEPELELSKRKGTTRKKELHVDQTGKREGERMNGPLSHTYS